LVHIEVKILLHHSAPCLARASCSFRVPVTVAVLFFLDGDLTLAVLMGAARM
jgi:hypothetical protein